MKIRPEILDHWPEVSARFPTGFDMEATARSRGAFTRAREIKNAETLLRLALAYGGPGVSLPASAHWMGRRSANRELIARHGGCMSATTWRPVKSISLS